jgi:hypothetical protein
MVETGVAYFDVRTLRHVRADLEDMAAHHCTYVVHCLTETDLLYYRQTMREIVDATHEGGLEAWIDPWGVTGIFSGESLTRFPLDHPEAWQVLSDGRRVPVGCPNHPATRQFLRNWVAAAAEVGGDVLFWDEPHFYVPFLRGDSSGAWACRCETCGERFRHRTGHEMPEELSKEVQAFREASLIELLAELSAEGRRLGMRNALCLLPMDFATVGLPELAERLAKAAGGTNPLLQFGVSDWDAAAAIPDLDIFGTDPYWYLLGAEPEAFTRAFTRRALEAAGRHGRQTQIWVQAFSVPEGREEELGMGLRVAAEMGASHLAAWSYDGTASMSSIRPARPDVVWRVIGEAFAEVRAGRE